MTNNNEVEKVINERVLERLSRDKKFFPRETTFIIKDLESDKEYKSKMDWKTIKEMSVLHDINAEWKSFDDLISQIVLEKEIKNNPDRNVGEIIDEFFEMKK